MSQFIILSAKKLYSMWPGVSPKVRILNKQCCWNWLGCVIILSDNKALQIYSATWKKLSQQQMGTHKPDYRITKCKAGFSLFYTATDKVRALYWPFSVLWSTCALISPKYCWYQVGWFNDILECYLLDTGILLFLTL